MLARPIHNSANNDRMAGWGELELKGKNCKKGKKDKAKMGQTETTLSPLF